MAKNLQCVVVTPERAVLDEAADFVAVPMYDGELGVLPGRLPLIGRLGSGELRVQHEGKSQSFYIDGGFLQIRNNVVTLLTAKALRAEDIKPDFVVKALKEAQTIATTDESIEANLQAQTKARTQLRIAQKR